MSIGQQIHPIYAMLLSFASIPISYSKYICQIAYFLDITNEEAENIIKPFLDRDEPFHSHYGGVVSQFPRNVIIDTDKATIFPLEYNPEEFNFDSVDLQQERSFYSPSTVVSCQIILVLRIAFIVMQIKPMDIGK
mgnify:CR=1 FL=1